MSNKGNSVVLLYSGGLDSTCMAIDLIKRYDEVHLLSFDLSYCIMNGNSIKDLEALRRVNTKCKVVFRRISLRNRYLSSLVKDFQKFCGDGAPGVLCLGCRMAMIEEGIKYCLNKNIGFLSTGHTINQISKAHAYPEILNRFIDLMNKYGIGYDNSIYSITSREKEKKILLSHGLNSRFYFGQSNPFNEPRCIIGPITTLWMMSERLNRKKMISFYDHYLAKIEARLGRPSRESRVSNRFDMKLLNINWRHYYEFSKGTDKFLGVLLSPIWFFARLSLSIFARTLKRNKND